MRNSIKHTIAVVGVVVAAVAAGVLVMPAARQLGTFDGLWRGAAIMGLPILAVLAVTGYPHYGGTRSVAVGAVVALITCVVTWIVAVFTFVTALSGSTTGLLVAIVLFGCPALCVVIVGLLAQRVVPAASDTDRQMLSAAPGQQQPTAEPARRRGNSVHE
jgi:hypothetical protein